MKKILFIGSNPKNSGGVETFGRILQEVFKNEIKFFSIFQSNQMLYDVKNVYEIFPHKLIYRIFNKITKNVYPNFCLNKIIEKNDILLLNSPNDLKKIYTKNLHKKIILVQHQTSEAFLKRKDYLNNDQKLLKKMKNVVDKIITLSPKDRFDFIQNFQLKEEKVTYIRHCSKIEILNYVKEPKKKIVTICRIVNKHKRIDLMLEGMKKLSEFKLEIWGDGPDKEQLEKKIKEMNLSNVKFMGKTSKVQEKLDDNSIFLLTSDYEGYPIAAIEAIRRGLPLVIRNTFVSAEDLIEGNGILLNKKWDIDEMVNSINEIYLNYKEYSMNSIKLAKKYEFTKFEESWIKEMKNTIKK